MKLRLLAIVLGLTLLAPLAQAQFSGNFALTPPPGGLYTSNTTLGAWNFDVDSHGGGTSAVNTGGAPNSFALFSSGSGITQSSTATMSIGSVYLTGNISFTYNFTSSTGGMPMGQGTFSYTVGSHSATVPFSDSNTVLWSVTAGDAISFTTFAQGADNMSFDPMMGMIITPASNSASVVISNFSFTPTAVPEPSQYAMGAGVLALGAVAWRRSRKKAV